MEEKDYSEKEEEPPQKLAKQLLRVKDVPGDLDDAMPSDQFVAVAYNNTDTLFIRRVESKGDDAVFVGGPQSVLLA